MIVDPSHAIIFSALYRSVVMLCHSLSSKKSSTILSHPHLAMHRFESQVVWMKLDEDPSAMFQSLSSLAFFGMVCLSLWINGLSRTIATAIATVITTLVFTPTRLPDIMEFRKYKRITITWMSLLPVAAFVVASLEERLEAYWWMRWVPAYSPWSWLLLTLLLNAVSDVGRVTCLVIYALFREWATLSIFDVEETLDRSLIRSPQVASANGPPGNTTAGSASYEYEPLPPETFRLIRLTYDPTSPDAPAISLVLAPYADPPIYFAISYTWGPPQTWDSQSITIDGASMAMASNVRRIIEFHAPRRKHTAKYIWIDAVCINQRSRDEKTSQVRRMDEIYRNARGVTVWLGDGSISTREAALAARRLWQLFLYSTAVDASMFCLALASTWFVRLRDAEAWEALRILLTRPWFSRVWVFQELVLARHVRVVYSGRALPWRLVASAGEICLRHSRFPVVGEMLRRGGNIRSAGVRWRDETPELYHPAMFEKYRKRLRERTGQGGGVDSTEFLRMCRGFLATDPRDKVFALIGLSEDGREDKRLMADYSKPTGEVMLDAARYFVEKGKLCEVLCEAGIGWGMDNSTLGDVRLPSWVPNWATSRLEVSRLSGYHSDQDSTERGFEYRACHKSRRASSSANPVLMREGSNQSLRVRVVLAGQTIRQLGSIYRLETDGTGHMADVEVSVSAWKWRCEAKEIAKASRARYPVAGHIQTREEAFWRTMVADRLDDAHYKRQDRPVPPECDEIYRLLDARDELLATEGPDPRGQYHLWRVLAIFDRAGVDVMSADFSSLGPTGKMADMEFFAEEAVKTTRGRRFCLTSQGFIGLVPPCTNVGDVLCVVPGAQAPFLLRPTAETKQFYLVGECFVHGMMDGEAHLSGKETDVQIL